MARTNDFTSRYLERRRELLGTGLSGRTNNQTDTGSSGSSRVTPASAESGQTQGTQRATTGGNDFTSGYLERRRELMAGRTEGQQRPSATPSTTRPSVMSALRQTTPFSFSPFQFLTTRPSGGAQSGNGQQQASTPSTTMSSTDMSARMDELRELRDAAEKERNEARTVMNGSRYMTQSQRDEWSARLEEAEANYSRYDKEYNDLLSRYYQTENEEKRASLQQDEAMSAQYQSAQDIQSDMDKVTAVMAYTTTHDGDAAQVEEYKNYLFEKYGLDQKAIDQYAIAGAGGAYVPRTDGGYNNIYDLYLELEKQKEQAVSTLAEGGYDYERMTGYTQMQEDAERYQENLEEWQQYAREHPILSSVDSLLVAPFQGFDFARVMLNNMGHGDIDDPENYVPVNSYTMDATNYVNTVRQSVSEDIEENTDWELFGQNVASFLYQTGMSIGDSTLNLAAFGPTGALVVGSSTAAANQAKDIIDRGGTKEQAFMGGLAAGAFEAIFEKVSIDNLLATKSVTGWKTWLKETAKQAGVEASEETFTEIANILADAAIMGDNSNYDVAVRDYIAQGMSQEDAERQAFMDLIGQVVQAGVGGALSGGVMGGTVNAVNGMANAAYNRYNQQQSQENTAKNGTVLETTAQETEEQRQNTAEIDNDIPEATRAAIEMLVNGEEISGNQAARIAQNEEAVALLSQLTGEEVNTDAPISRVKSDIRSLASRSAGVSTDAGTAVASQTLQGRTTAEAAYDMSRMQRSAEASGFGDNGKKALTAGYDGMTDGYSYYAGFAAYYNAGVTGVDMEKVRSDYTSALNSAQKYAAYSAGQNDAAVSLAAEREGAKYATVYGDEAGLIQNDHVAKIPKQTAILYNTLAKAAGVKIELVDQVRTPDGRDGGNGVYLPGRNTIQISLTSEGVQGDGGRADASAFSVVAAHEITHRIQSLAPEAYRKYRDYAMNAIGERQGGVERAVYAKQQQYAESGVNLTAEQAMDELAADFTRDMLEDASLFRKLARADRSLAKRALDALKNFIRKVKSAFSSRSAQNREAMGEYGVSMAELERAAKLWQSAYDAAAQEVRRRTDGTHTTSETDGEARFSIRKVDGKNVVWIENSSLTNKELNNHKAVAEFIAQHIGEVYTIIESGQKVYIGPDLPGEYTQSRYTSYLRQRDGKSLKAKNKAVDGLGELIETATNRRWERTRHAKSKDAKYGMYRYDSTFAFPIKSREGTVQQVRAYDAELLIRNASDGKKYLYDIVGIKENTTSALDLMQREARKGSRKAAARGDVSDASIAETGEDVNARFSLKSRVDEMQENYNRITRRVQELSRKQAQIEKSPEHQKFLEAVYSSKGDALDAAMEQYKKWSDENGLSDVASELADLKKQSQEAFRNFERAKSEALNEARAEYRAKFDEEFSKKYASKAARKFGTTSRFDLAGYLTVNGSLLDFSERQGYRVQDHREIAEVLDFLPDYAEYSDGMIEFMNMGNIRLQTYGIDIAKAPNAKQRSMLRKFFNSLDGEVTVDFSRENGSNDGSIDYPEGTRADKILRDIDSYFSTGTVPEQSAVSMFHTRYSLKSSDNQGRELSESQREYFKDSVVRDSQGRLKAVYHGSTADFNEFSLQYLGTNGTAEGYGFYFTDNREIAEGYSHGTEAQRHQGANGRLYEVYLDIKKPLSNDSVTMTRAEFRRFITEMNKQVDEDGEPLDFLANYGDVSYEGLDNVIRAVIRAEYDGSDSDVNMIHSIINGNGNMEIVFDVLRKTTGFDGIVVDNASWGDGQSIYIVFHPEQIKNVDNKTPTTSPDIRYSLKYDNIGHQLSDDQAKFFENTKVVDENGNLLRVYHGSRSVAFTEFDLYEGVWLTPDRRYAEVYASDWHSWRDDYGDRTRDDINGLEAEVYDDPDLRVYELYANITNPADLGELDDALTEKTVRKLAKTLGVKYAELSEIARDYIGEYTYQLTRSREFIELAKRMGFDGFSATESGRDTFCAIYAPEQAKLVSNQTPTQNSDIRYSRKGNNLLRENAALQEENAILRERVEYWKGQTRRTQRVTTDKKAVARAARELIRTYHSDLSADEIAGDLQSLYDYIASGRDGNNELTYSEARRRSDEIARKLVDAATETDGTYKQYKDLRDYVRTTALYVSEEDSRDIPDYGAWRRQRFGRMNLRKGPTNIDQVYQEMSYLWPEFFDEQRHSNPMDQLLHIAEVLDGIYSVEERNPFGAYLSEVVTDASNEIMETFFDLPQTRKTFADRQAARIDETRAKGQQRLQRLREQRDARLAELRAQNRERVQRAVQRERETRARQIDRLKTRYAERDASARERRSARELRARIIRHTKDLSAKLLRPSDKQHIPESLRKAVASVLESINLESVYTIDPETGKRKKGGNGDPTKRTAAFRELRQAYSNITKEGADYTLVIDPDLMDNLNEIEAMKDTPIAEMGTAQLSTIWSTIKAVEASIRTANKMLGASRFQTISQVAEGIRNDNIMRSDRGDYRGALGKIDKLVNLDMLTPQGYFHRLGRTGDDIFRMLRSAQDRHIEIMHEAQRATKDIIGKLDVRKLERETHTFDLDGQKVTLSTAQIMSLYELMKRKQAQDHIFTGGIRPDAVRGGRGIRESRRADAVRVTVEDLAEITGKLTEEQIRIADGLQKYMGGRLAELGNQASMEVYGYQKFNEPDYFPIQVDKNQTQKDIAKDAQAQTIAGRGFTKSTTPKANNAVMVGSIFDIFSSHVNDMATYAAWLSTMENVRRIRDFTYRDSEGNRTGTVKSVIERVFGRNGNSYLNKLVDDLNQGVRASGSGNFMDGIIGNYKAAAVAANLRVVLQQPTAILRALNTIDAKYLIAGSVRRGDWEKVMKYAPIARWKDWGYFDINTGRQMKDVLLGSSSAMEKIKQASMAPAGKADSFAWARLWNAVEAETKARRPGLKPGTDAFYKAVADRFSQVIDQSQVVDGILQRSQIMRSPDALTKMSTSFMAEPTKTYNMFVNAVYDLRHATGRDARKTARKVLARTSTALVVSFTVNAVMQSIADALRDDDRELDYWEKMLQAFTGFSGDEESFLDYWNSFWSGNLEANFNPLGYIPYLKDLASIMQGYDVSRMDMEPITKVWEAFTNMRKALSGEGKYSIAGASATMLSEVARLFGVPVANLKRDIQAAVTTAAIETDNYLMQYRIDKALLNIGYQGNRSGFMDILYAASINDPEAYEFIYEGMVSSGITEEQIRNDMESRMKDDQGVESVADLEKRYLTPNQEKTYDSLYGQVSNSSVWRSANQEQKDSIEEDIYNLAVGTDAGEKLMEKIEGGSSYGISEADYLLYLAAREIVDSNNDDPEKRNGSIDQEEAEAAIDMLTGLSDEARAYLWQSTNKGWKEEKNPYR